jgi:hypothetical protein
MMICEERQKQKRLQQKLQPLVTPRFFNGARGRRGGGWGALEGGELLAEDFP